MSAGIVKGIDKGAVGYYNQLGKTWHQFPEYEHIDGPVTMEKAREVLGYEVEKIPLSLFVPEYLRKVMPENTHGMIVPSMYALVRKDSGTPVFNMSVSNDFTIYQNLDFLNELESGLFTKYPELRIESIGSLFAGRVTFVNILLHKFQINKDNSETITRMMFTNAFGGHSISGCAHGTRVVCNNTMLVAEAQGVMNGSMKKYRHTKGAPKKVEQGLVDLAELNNCVKAYKEQCNFLADRQMDSKEVDVFLGNMFEIKEDDSGKTTSTRKNKQEELRSIWEKSDDLQGEIARTRYAMYQAVINYSQYKTIAKDADENYTWFNIVSGGNRHTFNQKALDLLSEENIVKSPMMA